MSRLEQEPTLEEILASIRNIIGGNPAPAQGAADLQLEAIREPEIEVLELTQEMVRRPPEPKPVPPPPRGNEPRPEKLEEIPSGDVASNTTDGGSIESVFEGAVRESFARVLHTYLDNNSPSVTARLKPQTFEWMDENLPALLDTIVRAEMARIVLLRRRP